MAAKLQYLDISLGEEAPDARNPPPMATNVVKSAPFIDNASDWYVAVSRFSLNISGLPNITPAMANDAVGAAPPVTTNGLDLAAAVQVVWYNSATDQIAGPAVPLQLIKDPAEVIAPLYQPEPAGYSFMSWPAWVAALNAAVAAATAGTAAALAPGVLAEPPSFAISGQFLQQVLPTSALYDWSPAAPWPRVAVVGNAHLYNYWRGLNLQLHPMAPPGQSVRLQPECQATTWLNEAPTGARTPGGEGAAFTSTSVELLPSNVGARSLEVLTTLPVVQEVSPGPIARAQIMTDFMLSAVDVQDSQGVVTYNAGGIGQARWCKLVGAGPIQAFSLSVRWRDDRGRSYDVPAGWGRSSIKVAFAMNRVVEGQ
jgi:hypothetical protein